MEPVLSKVDAVVFDCFGTLLNVKIFGASTALADSVLPHVPKQVVHEAMMTSPGSTRLLINLMGGNADSREAVLFDSLMQREISSIDLFPDVLKALDTLSRRGIKIGVCGNAAQAYAAVAQSKLKDYVTAFSWSHEVGVMKPSPLIFKDILAKLNVAPDRALMVGDSKAADIAGAEHVGMRAALIHRLSTGEGYSSLNEIFADHVFAESRSHAAAADSPVTPAWDMEAEAAKFMATRKPKHSRPFRPGHPAHR